MQHPDTAVLSVNRIIRWRYRTAVQAARMLNSAGGDPRGRHSSRIRTDTGLPRTERRHDR